MSPHEFMALYRFPVISKYYCGSVMTIYKEVIGASVCIHFLFLCCWRQAKDTKSRNEKWKNEQAYIVPIVYQNSPH